MSINLTYVVLSEFYPDTTISTYWPIVQERFNAQQLDALFDASNAYFNALILKSNLKILVTNMNLTKKNLQIAEENFEAGLAGKSDVFRFRSELAQDMQAMDGINFLTVVLQLLLALSYYVLG